MGKYFEEDGKPRYWWGHVLLFPLYCVVIPLGLVKETVILATCCCCCNEEIIKNRPYSGCCE